MERITNTMNGMGTILTAVVGESAVVGTEMVMPDAGTIETIGQLIIQLAIGIVTIWKLVKKPKK